MTGSCLLRCAARPVRFVPSTGQSDDSQGRHGVREWVADGLRVASTFKVQRPRSTFLASMGSVLGLRPRQDGTASTLLSPASGTADTVGSPRTILSAVLPRSNRFSFPVKQSYRSCSFASLTFSVSSTAIEGELQVPRRPPLPYFNRAMYCYIHTYSGRGIDGQQQIRGVEGADRC